MDPEGSASRLYPEWLVKRCEQNTQEPYQRGRLEYTDDGQPLGWLDGEGDFLLWTYLRDGKPDPGETFSVGCDVSFGVGSTPSVLSVTSKRTGEKVAQYSSAHVSPDRFEE